MIRSGLARGFLSVAIVVLTPLQDVHHIRQRLSAAASPFLGGITMGRDENLWFVESHGVGRITPSGRVTEFPIPGSVQGGTGSIVGGPDGNLWATVIHAIIRVSLSGRVHLFSLSVKQGQPSGIASGPDGNLWFTANTESNDRGMIGKMTVGGRMTEYLVPTHYGSVSSITTGPDHNLWFTETNRDKIGRITPRGHIREFPLPPISPGLQGTSHYPTDITSGPDGNLWFTQFERSIGRITLRGIVSGFSLASSGIFDRNAVPLLIAHGPDGNLWFTEIYGNGVGRITPTGHATVFPLPTANSGPTGITTGPDGNLWVTATCSNRIERMTPAGQVKEFNVSPSTRWSGEYCIAPI